MLATNSLNLPLGQLLATPGALSVLERNRVRLFDLIKRHQAGDWGDISPDDWAANDLAVAQGGRILSAYLTSGGRFWVITEADRSATTVLLPEEY